MSALEQHAQSCTGPTPEFSVIIACYYEENSIREFYLRLSRALQGLGRSYEIVFVNDGSMDKTFEVLRDIHRQDIQVAAVIDLFKNSGQAAAVTAGVRYARGRHFVLMDSDLQLDPEELPLLVAEFDKNMDVVSGCRKERKDSLFRIIPSKMANVIMRKVSESSFTDFGCTFKIIRGELVRGFELGPYKPLQVPNLIAKAQRCAEVPVTHHPRKYGQSGWTFRKLFAYNMDNLVCLSERPFQLLGAVCFLFTSLFVIRVVLSHVFDFSIIDEVTPGLILNAVMIALMAVVAVLCLIGEFVIRNFVALQKRPAYIIREVVTKHPDAVEQLFKGEAPIVETHNESTHNEHDFLESVSGIYSVSAGAYSRVKRAYAIRTFHPFMQIDAPRNAGRVLQLGCADGYETLLLSKRVHDLNVLDGSEALIRECRKKVDGRVHFKHGLFEDHRLSTDEPPYDYVFASYVLEHVLDVQTVLTMVRTVIRPSGLLFVVVPNARALSRQLALHMKLIPGLKELTPNDKDHGHRRVYDRVSLNADLENAGFALVAQGGLMFKFLADFQLDQLLDNGFLTSEHMEGLYRLGLEYPDLCDSLFAVCRPTGSDA